MEFITEPPSGSDFWNWLYNLDSKLPDEQRITTDNIPAEEYDADPDEIDAHCRELKRTRGVEPPEEYREFLGNIRIIGGRIGRRYPLDEITPPENITDVFCGIWRLQFENLELRPDSVNPLVPLFDLGDGSLYCLFLGKPGNEGKYPIVEVSHPAGCRFGVEGCGIQKFLAASVVKATLNNNSRNSLTPIEITRRVAQIDPCAGNYYRLYRALCDTGNAEGAETALNAAKSVDYDLGHPAACGVTEWFEQKARPVRMIP
ncbi:MAG: SMI1/KNR4 family protein [Planctomycetota bacterium]|jgi:hypothetical protein